jgi:poly(A) polymerase
LGLQPADATAEPIAALAPLLASVPSARLFEEIKKSFFHGYAEAMFGLIERYGILPTCFADLDQHLPDPPSQALIDQALVNTDLRFHQGQSLNPAFLLSVFLWPMLQKHIDSALRQGCKPYMAKQNAMSEVLKQQTKVMAISRRLTVMMKEIWSFQHLLEQRRPRQIRYVILQKRFRAAYDFLCLRASIDPALQPLADWWTSYQMQDAKEQEAMVSALHTGKSQRDKV